MVPDTHAPIADNLDFAANYDGKWSSMCPISSSCSSDSPNDLRRSDKSTWCRQHFPTNAFLVETQFQKTHDRNVNLTWWIFAGTFDGGDGVSFGDSPMLCGDSPRIRFRATEQRDE